MRCHQPFRKAEKVLQKLKLSNFFSLFDAHFGLPNSGTVKTDPVEYGYRIPYSPNSKKNMNKGGNV
jgi:hypothetical protein